MIDLERWEQYREDEGEEPRWSLDFVIDQLSAPREDAEELAASMGYSPKPFSTIPAAVAVRLLLELGNCREAEEARAWITRRVLQPAQPLASEGIAAREPAPPLIDYLRKTAA